MTQDKPASIRSLVAVIGVGGAITALMLYLVLGLPKGAPTNFPAPTAGGHDQPQSVENMVERLARRLEENPENGAGWLMLARSYAALGRFAEAARAYARAVAILPEQADTLADYADVLAMMQGRTLRGEPEKLALRALAADPENIKALALAGTAAFEREDYKAALSYWKKASSLVPADAEFGASLKRSMADAESHLAAAGKTAASGSPLRPAR